MYSPDIKLEVRRLRSENGLTFKEIKAKIPYLHKSTISSWVRDIKLKPEHEKRIIIKQLKRRSEFLVYNRQKQEKALENAKHITNLAKKEVGNLSRRDLMIAGAALYWSEGSMKNQYLIEIANSNPRLIALAMRFFREIIEIPENKFRCKLILHPNLNQKEVLNFWSNLTRVPLSQFNKIYIKPPISRTGKMFNKLYNGTLIVRISDRNRLLRLKGFVESLK